MSDSLGASLFVFAANGDLEGARQILAEHADLVREFINFSDEEGWSPLMKASLEGHLSLVQLLINAKANVNHISQSGYTSLMVAAVEGHTKIVRTLVIHGAELDARDEDGATALIWACKGSDCQVANILIELGADIHLPDHSGLTPLMAAACNNQQETVRQLLARGVEINAKHSDGSTALLGAAEEGNTAIVQILLLAGAVSSIVSTSSESNTGSSNLLARSDLEAAIKVAVQGEHDEVVKILEHYFTGGSLGSDGQVVLNPLSRRSQESLALATIGTATAAQDRAKLRLLVEELIDSQVTQHKMEQEMLRRLQLENTYRAELQAQTSLVDTVRSENARLVAELQAAQNEKEGILAQLERIKADLDCTEEEASFLGKELADAKIRIQEIWTSQEGSSQRSKSHSHEVSTGVLGGIFWS